MTKKEYILQILTRLSWIREYADGLKVIVEWTEIEESVIDGLYTLMSVAVSETLDVQTQQALQKGMSILKKIAYVESQEKVHLDEELALLLQQL